MTELTPSNLHPTPTPRSTRAGTADDALRFVRQLIEDNTRGERGRKWAQWMGMFQGNAPFSSRDKRITAKKWQSNFNTMQGKGRLKMACVPYYNLFEGGPEQAVVRLKGNNADDKKRKSRTATRHLRRTLQEANISDAFYRLVWSFVGFGRGFWYWPSPLKWFPDAKAFYEVLFPESTLTDPKRWEQFAVRVKMTPAELFGYVRDNEPATEAGWNVPACIMAIQASQPTKGFTREPEDWVSYQQALHEHDLATTASSTQLDLAYVYTKEWDGKWSLGVVQVNQAARDRNGRTVTPEWLFHKFGAADCVTDLIVPFIYEPADGRINGAEGLANDIFASVSVSDRLVNTMVDGGFLRSMPLLSPNSASARVQGGLTVAGGAIYMPSGHSAQSGQVMADLNGPLLVQRMLTDIVSQTSGVFMPGVERPIGNPDTATATQVKAQQQTTLSASGISRFYNCLDVAYRTIYTRILDAAEAGGTPDDEQKLAKEFVKRCKADGVTMKDLRDFDQVLAYRVAGTGSALQRQQALGSIFALAGAMPIDGRQNLYAEITSAAVGPGKVDEFWPEDMDEPGEGDWEANVENVQAMNGSQPMFTDNQVHEAHARVHINALVQGIESVQQGAAPESVYAFGQLMIPHTELHTQGMAQDPSLEQKAKAFDQQLKILAQQYNQLPQLIRERQQQAQDAQRAQMVQAGMDPKLQLQAAEKQARTQMKATQQSQDMRMKEARHQQELRQAAEKHAQEMRQASEPRDE